MSHDGSDAVEREADLRSYLLGTLPAERQEEIDERSVTDPDLHEELQATADDLIHAYLAGQLTAAERERFEAHFLTSPRRRERLAFMRTLVTTVDRVRSSTRPARAARAVSLLPWAAILVVALGGGALSVAQRHRSDRDLTAAGRREDALRQELTARDARVRELEAQAAGAAPADLATWVLGNGGERGPAGTESFTVRGDWIRLRVPVEHDLRVASYRAILQTSAGTEVFRMGGLREATPSRARTVDVIVPGGLLRPGAYVLSLQRDGPGRAEELAATTFVVR